jgi:hypothetical protein
MSETSAAIVVLAGAILLATYIMQSGAPATARQAAAGLGLLLVVLGVAAWAAAFVNHFLR